MKQSLAEKIQFEFMGLDASTPIVNPFNTRTKEDLEKPHLHVLRMMKNPDYFYFTCKSLMNGPNGKPLELLPFQCVILKELWYRSFPMLIASRGASKSFILGLYSILRALFIQGRKIVITGSGFRQAKTVFNYAETIWNNSPILRSLVSEHPQSGSHHSPDRFTLRLGDSTITALPLGSGDKIRGERAHDILCDEFACLDVDTLIDTPAGLRRIGDTMANWDFSVYTGYGDDIEKVNKYIRTPPMDAYRIKTMGGYEFVCSDIHKVGTADDWKFCHDLTVKDYIELPPPIKFTENYIDRVDVNTAWLLGILTAEGSVNGYSQVHDDLYALGLDRTTAHHKKIPWSILQSPRDIVISFLSGLFEGDGSAFLFSCKGVDNKFGVAYYSVSEQLCREVQVLLYKLGFFCTRRKRRSKLSKNWQWMLRLNGRYALDFAELLNIPKWSCLLQKANRINIKKKPKNITFLKDKNKWRASFKFKGKNKYIGNFNTEQEALNAVSSVTNNQSLYLKVFSIEKLQDQRVLYDYYLPKSHSFVGNCIRQHNSVPWEIFETVVSGFGVVELDPIAKVKRRAEIRVLKKEKLWTSEMSEEERKRIVGNQTIISGTGYYQFNHFYDYWKRWKGIIESRGNNKLLTDLFPNGLEEDKFDWRDYSIIRMPVNLLPEGFMDDKQVARSRATQHLSIYLNEFSACFASDSNGFYKRSLIESCVTKQPIMIDGESIQFRAATRGKESCHYVFGIDPASEHDRFSIVILEVHPSHRRIVYCWTTTRKDHSARIKAGLITDADFYGFCCRKIRDLMKSFNCEHIALDSQGGGVAVAESLHDPDKMQKGEHPIWLITSDHPLSDKKERDSDGFAGLHIIEMVNFASAQWVAEANHGLRKDFEDKILLFPEYDPGLLAIAMEDDERTGRIFDTLEAAVEEVEEIKEELSTIVHSQTPGSLRDKWDTPEVKLAGSKKGRLRKDRYSALLMANSAARRLNRQVEVASLEAYGGFVTQGQGLSDEAGGKMYSSGPEWFTKGVEGDRGGHGWAIRKSGVD